MRPTIVQNSDITGPALADLKAWLGVSRPNEDALLIDLLAASLATCEETIAQAPLRKTVEERLPAKMGWHCLSSVPAIALAKVETISSDGTRNVLADQSSNFDYDAYGNARFQITEAGNAGSFAIQFDVGIANIWEDLPPALKQGIIRLAAFYFRERDQADAKAMPLPHSVAMLWQPWRKVRLT